MANKALHATPRVRFLVIADRHSLFEHYRRHMTTTAQRLLGHLPHAPMPDFRFVENEHDLAGHLESTPVVVYGPPTLRVARLYEIAKERFNEVRLVGEV